MTPELKIRQLAHKHLVGTGDDCIIQFARAIESLVNQEKEASIDHLEGITNMQREVITDLENRLEAAQARAAMSDEDIMDAAEKVAEEYAGDDREGIETDVMNAFYKGVAFARAIRGEKS